MKKIKQRWAKNSLCGRIICRLLGEEKGAVAMEYIVIALLVAAAVVGLVMVFSGNLRNMFDKTSATLNAKKVSDVEQVGTDYNKEQDALAGERGTAVKAGDKLGGDFSDSHEGVKTDGGEGGGGEG